MGPGAGAQGNSEGAGAAPAERLGGGRVLGAAGRQSRGTVLDGVGEGGRH